MNCKHFAAAFALLVPALATAQPAGWSLGSFYAGASLGGAWHDIDRGSLGRQLSELGYTGNSVSSDDSDVAWKVFGGWQPHPNVALELSYFDLGRPRFGATFFRPGELDARLKVTGWALDVVPQWQFANNWTVFGRAGYARSETEARLSGSGAFDLLETRAKRNQDSWNAGLGVGYAFNRNLVVRGEWTFFSDLGHRDLGGRFDANVVSVSALWRFP
jgi:OmpA-OmpF porin, OOP family